MKRPLRDLLATCRGIRQAVSLWTWLSAGYASVAECLSRLRQSISGFVMGLFGRRAAPAPEPGRKKNDSEPRPDEKPRWRRWRPLASIFGSAKSKPADPTSRTAPRSSRESSSTSAARAASRRCSSSSTTTRGPAPQAAPGCSKRSFGSSRRTSTRVASKSRSHCGPKTNWSRNCRPASSRP